MMAGALAIMQLPAAQHPTIAPPWFLFLATLSRRGCADGTGYGYLRLSNKNMNGNDNLMYMSSTSDLAGVTITPDLPVRTDPISRRFRCKINCSSPRAFYRRKKSSSRGLALKKSSSSFLLMVAVSPHNPNTTRDAFISGLLCRL